ncbi:acyltransferase [uncultured Methylibium sp.]|uniref:acyltransferase n=1 Tax=uncultured Methylibium sp. TaxID=381093 RepID=UPI0025EEA724|nr:acyltransferase [uncultured Methylibium sp.]
MKTLARTANSLLSLLRNRDSRVTVGSTSRINWWRLGKVRGRLTIGEQAIVQCRIDFDSPDGEVVVGDRSYIGASHIVCHSRVEIGNDVIISWGVTVVDHNSHSLNWQKRRYDVTDWMQGRKNWTDVAVAPVSIQDKVWIGFGAVVLKGVCIGEGAVVGAHAVVTRDVQPYTVVAGNPARPIRHLENHGGGLP